MVGVAEVHFEVVPGAVLQDAHVPRAGDRVRKLPDDVKAFFVGEAFVVGLEDGVAALPEVRAKGVQGVAAVFGFRSLQVLEGVDGFDFGEEVREPCDAGLRFAVAEFFEEVGDFVLADGAVGDGIAFKDGDFDFVVAGEEQGFPFLFGAFFDGEFVVGVLEWIKSASSSKGGNSASLDRTRV